MSQVYKLYRKGADGAPELVLQKPDGVASTFGKATLVEDLQSLASKDFVNSAIENLAHSSLGGRVDTEGDLPTEDIKVGTIYLVGLADAESFEEFIYTEEGTWDRMGSIRQSDVNLSGYTNTSDFTAALGTATGTVDGNIVEMTDTLTTQLGALQTEFEEGLGSVLKESEFTDAVPTEWPAHMDLNGSLYVIGGGDTGPSATPADYDLSFGVPAMVTGLHMGSAYSGVRPGVSLASPKDMVFEGRYSSGEWVQLWTGTNPTNSADVDHRFVVTNEEFYEEYRLRVTSVHDGPIVLISCATENVVGV